MGEDKSPIMLVAFSIVFKINNIGKEIYKPYKNVVILTSTFENLINLTDVDTLVKHYFKINVID